MRNSEGKPMFEIMESEFPRKLFTVSAKEPVLSEGGELIDPFPMSSAVLSVLKLVEDGFSKEVHSA